MTDKIKRDARARQSATGEPYTRALRAVARQDPPPAGPGSPGAAVAALLAAWDPSRLPAAAGGAGRDAGWEEEWSEAELEDQERADDAQRRNHLRLKSCAACGKPSRRVVRRWQVGKVSFAADPDDPHRDQYGNVSGLSQPPSFTGQPSWGACGTVCARRIIVEDRARPAGGIRVAGNDEFFYQAESFRYQPHDSELPGVLVRLRRNTDLIDYSGGALDRAVAAGDMALAAMHLAALRRDIARTAAVLAELGTWTPPARRFPPGSPEPDGIQVRHGGAVYSNMSFLNFDRARRDHWEGPGGTRYTWLELTEMAAGGLTEVPREHVRVPRDSDQDDDLDD
jgi:hypothetical protein